MVIFRDRFNLIIWLVVWICLEADQTLWIILCWNLHILCRILLLKLHISWTRFYVYTYRNAVYNFLLNLLPCNFILKNNTVAFCLRIQYFPITGAITGAAATNQYEPVNNSSQTLLPVVIFVIPRISLWLN